MAPDLLADVDDQPEGVNPQCAAEQALMAALLRWREAEAIERDEFVSDGWGPRRAARRGPA